MTNNNNETSSYGWKFEGEFTGKGKIVVDGKEQQAEFKFIGKYKDTDRENKIITFDLIEQGKDNVLSEVVFKG